QTSFEGAVVNVDGGRQFTRDGLVEVGRTGCGRIAAGIARPHAADSRVVEADARAVRRNLGRRQVEARRLAVTLAGQRDLDGGPCHRLGTASRRVPFRGRYEHTVAVLLTIDGAVIEIEGEGALRVHVRRSGRDDDFLRQGRTSALRDVAPARCRGELHDLQA